MTASQGFETSPGWLSLFRGNMGLRDRRRGSENVTAKIQPSGRAAMPQDPRMNNRNHLDHLAGSKAEIYRGRVVHSLAQFGWHQVVLDNGGIVSAEPTGHADKWGSQTIHVYQPGVQVICAVSSQKGQCVILAQVPDVVGDRNDQYVLASSIGTKVGIETDPSAQVFLDAIKENDDTSAYEINPKSDQLVGDWGCRTNTGVAVTVDSWVIDLTVDEVTGLSLDLVTQGFDLSGRAGVIEADHFRLSSTADCYSAQFSLGPSWFQTAYDKQAMPPTDSQVDTESLRYDQYNLLRPYNVFVIGGTVHQAFAENYYADWVAEVLVDPRNRVYGRSGYAGTVKYAVTDKLLQTGKLLTSMTSEMLTVETIMPGYAVGTTERSAHATIVKRLHKFIGTTDVASAMPVGPHTGVIASLAYMRDSYTTVQEKMPDGETPPPADYLFADRHEVGLLYNADNDAFESVEAHKAALANESILVSGQVMSRSLAFDRAKLTREDGALQRKDLRSIIQQDELTGDITLINEHGAGIRISGNTVFIEGGNVRVVSQKDVRIFGRDISMSSNRNITLASNKHTRVYAAKNVNVLAGSSGAGGVLIENRGSNTSNELPDDAEDAVYAGVTLKSTRSPISALGGNIVLRAGDYMAGVPGSLLITSQGSAIIASRDRVVLHSTVERLDTFGADYIRPTSSHLYASERVSFKGTLSAGQIWSQGSVIAKNDVQAATGRVADTYGSYVGKIRAPGRLIEALQQLEQTKALSMGFWSTSLAGVREEFQGDGKILNLRISSELSGGYVRSEKAANHYGAGRVSDTIPHLYRDALSIPTEAFRVHTVEYKPGSAGATKTYAFPGRTSTKVRCMVQSPLVVKIATADEWSPEFSRMQDQDFEQVFGTIRD